MCGFLFSSDLLVAAGAALWFLNPFSRYVEYSKTARSSWTAKDIPDLTGKVAVVTGGE